jgi:hypothetical protein
MVTVNVALADTSGLSRNVGSRTVCPSVTDFVADS